MYAVWHKSATIIGAFLAVAILVRSSIYSSCLVNKLIKNIFEKDAENLLSEKLTALQKLSFEDAARLPNAVPEDIVIAGKEVQLTVFRQSDINALPNAVLVTLQIVRAGLGGIINYQLERGVVYFASGETREATDAELLATA